MRERVLGWTDRLIGLAQRAAPGPMLVRAIAAGAAVVALIAALPADLLFSRQVAVIGPAVLLAAAGVGLFPRTRWVSAVALVAVAAWLFATFGFGDAATAPRVGLIAGSLYAMHAAAAFAATMPFDCVVAPAALLGWAIRQTAVLAGGLVVGLGGYGWLSHLHATPSIAGPVAGAVLAAAIAGLLAWQVRRGRL